MERIWRARLAKTRLYCSESLDVPSAGNEHSLETLTTLEDEKICCVYIALGCISSTLVKIFAARVFSSV